jgi:hypothetical protein
MMRQVIQQRILAPMRTRTHDSARLLLFVPYS